MFFSLFRMQNLQSSLVFGFFHLVYNVLLCSVLTLCCLWATVSAQTASPTVSTEFQPNYKINEQRNAVLDLLVKIEAQSQINQNPSEDLFMDLYNGFSQVFPYLPQQKTYKITYEQCLSLSDTLSQGFSFSTFTAFLSNCHRDLQKIMKEINSKYTVKAEAKIAPQSGPAPLTVTFDGRGSIDPSNETIPSDNFFRWYKDIDGIDRQIGK